MRPPSPTGAVAGSPPRTVDQKSQAILQKSPLATEGFTIGSLYHKLTDLSLSPKEPDANDHYTSCKYCDKFHQKYRKPLEDNHLALSDLSKIAEGLYLSNMCTAVAVMHGQEPSYNHITHVLSLHSGRWSDRRALRPTFATRHIVQKQIFLDDNASANLIDHFPEICHFIHSSLAREVTPEGRLVNILVHCYAGISRSATAIISYLIWARRYTLQEAIDFVQDRRHRIQPNFGFTLQLNLWNALDCNLDDPRYPDLVTVTLCKREKKANEPDKSLLEKAFHRPPKGHWPKAAGDSLWSSSVDYRTWCGIYWKEGMNPKQRPKAAPGVFAARVKSVARNAKKRNSFLRELLEMDVETLENLSIEDHLDAKLITYLGPVASLFSPEKGRSGSK